MPQLLPNSIVFYSADWMGPAGRLTWSVIFTTLGLFWVMLLMKHAAIKNKMLGPSFLVVGTLIGSLMALAGKTILDGSLTGNTLIPFGFVIAWFSFIGGIWTIIMSISFKQMKLPFSRVIHVLLTIAIMFGFYLIGGFVHSITILCAWLAALSLLGSISLYFWSLPKRQSDSTWPEAVAGGIASFILMAFIYAIIPHEWITFANSYLGWTKDVKLSAGGEFVLQTWLNGNFWTKQTRIIPFELNLEAIQDNATIVIYVVTAIINIKLFAEWQKRNDPVKERIKEDFETKPSKLSRFGRPVKALKASRA